ARLGVALPQLLQTYRVGHAVAWERTLALVEGSQMEPGQRSEILRLGSRYAFLYIDTVIPTITEAYAAERDGLACSDEARRLRALQEVLSGARSDIGELGYPVRGEHVGAVATGRDAPRALRALAAELGGASIIVDASGFTWAWLGVTKPTREWM